MVTCEKVFFQAFGNSKYINLQIDATQLFILVEKSEYVEIFRYLCSCVEF